MIGTVGTNAYTAGGLQCKVVLFIYHAHVVHALQVFGTQGVPAVHVIGRVMKSIKC